MTTTEVASLKRTELQAAACRVFGKSAATWTGRATNEELREALISGDVPAKFSNGHQPDLAAAIAAAINPLLHTQLDESRVQEIVEEKVASLAAFVEAKLQGTVHTFEVKRPDGPTVNVGRQHEAFPQLVKIMALRIPVYLRGAAGSGKTTAVEKAAEALGLPFYCQSMGPQTSQANLLGYMDANGRFVPGILFRPFKEGGVLCLDEIDNSNPSVLTVLNSALSNGYCSFPCGMERKHADFIVVAAGNTYGKGADALYVGRQQLDAACLNRFAILEWDYDPTFEKELAGTDQLRWTEHVQKVRATVERLKLRVVVSPRQSIMGATMLRAGFDWSEVERTVLWGGVGTDDRAKILANLQ